VSSDLDLMLSHVEQTGQRVCALMWGKCQISNSCFEFVVFAASTSFESPGADIVEICEASCNEMCDCDCGLDEHEDKIFSVGEAWPETDVDYYNLLDAFSIVPPQMYVVNVARMVTRSLSRVEEYIQTPLSPANMAMSDDDGDDNDGPVGTSQSQIPITAQTSQLQSQFSMASQQVDVTVDSMIVVPSDQQPVGRAHRGPLFPRYVAGLDDIVLESNCPTYSCGFMDCVCLHCGAKFWRPEALKPTRRTGPLRFPTCCAHGNVILAPLTTDPPHELWQLLSGTDSQSKEFRDNIRAYNSALSFVSVGVKQRAQIGNGPPTFVIQGQVVHRIGALLPAEGVEPKFCQIYVFDPSIQIHHRHTYFSGFNQTTMQMLQDALHRVNPFASLFRNCMSRLGPNHQLQRMVIRSATTDPQNPDPEYDRRRYNAPVSEDEIAVIIPHDTKEQSRDIIIQTQSQQLRRINDLHRAVDPMSYVLLFPCGDYGYELGIPHLGDNKRVTQREFYAFRIMVRERQPQFQAPGQIIFTPMPRPILHRGGRLFQQYVVDSYAKVENSQLRHQRDRQKHMRGDALQGLTDAIAAGDNSAENVGQRVYLSSSFTGGPRYMYQCYQDCMAIVRALGKPHLFLTMTCNPGWDEIVSECRRSGTEPHNRPDIIARVFHAKMRQLLREILEEHVFGIVDGYCYVVEFQKRGLPHAHMLLILREQINRELYSKFSCAEIPDPVRNPRLFQRVIESMVHSPCNTLGPHRCHTAEGRCRFGFPKPFSDSTFENAQGYMTYRRPAPQDTLNSRMITIRYPSLQGEQEKRYTIGSNRVQLHTARDDQSNRWIDNSWIVPYNPHLLLRYDCHINVEVCSSVRAVKYLFKYVYKGHDCAVAQIVDGNAAPTEAVSANVTTAAPAATVPPVVDEINDFVNGRYIGSSEACWRMFEYPLQGHKPTVVRLAVHLDGQQYVVYQVGAPQAAMDRQSQTTLTAWFEANETYPEARQLLYPDFPKRFVWEKTTKRWNLRQRNIGETIGRMYTAHPSSGEKFYLRMLLSHVAGARSFVDLRTLADGRICETYQDACRQLGLLEDDLEWRECLAEACATQCSGPQLRELFVVVLLFGNPANPSELWETFKDRLADDIQYRLQLNGHPGQPIQQNVLYNEALLDIQMRIQSAGRTLRAFGLPEPIAAVGENRELLDELRFDANAEQQFVDGGLSSLNEDQRRIFDRVAHLIQLLETDRQEGVCLPSSENSGAIFVDGPGGTGKTYLYHLLLAHVRARGHAAIGVASSGVAALLLPGGRTAHSRFKIPIVVDDSSSCAITKQSTTADLLRKALLIIWDEAPMCHRHVIEAFERTLRDVLSNTNRAFGGKIVIFGGDFRQVLPVVPRASRSQIVDSCLNKSQLWQNVEKHRLTINERVLRRGDSPEARSFCEYLLRIGDGVEPPPSGFPVGTIQLPTWACMSTQIVDDLIEYVFPHIDDAGLEYSLCDRAILTPWNDSAIDINNRMLLRIAGHEFTFLSADSVADDGNGDGPTNQAAPYPVEFLNTLRPSGFPSHELKIKIGAVYMLLRNINPAEGLCNGTRIIVVECRQYVIVGSIATGNIGMHGRQVLIPRCNFTSTETALPFVLKRRQFPLQAAFAMTINKAQGQTLQRVGIFLPRPVFGHGQLYVAMSRCTSFRDVRIMVCNALGVRNKLFTSNVVYSEVLENRQVLDNVTAAGEVMTGAATAAPVAVDASSNLSSQHVSSTAMLTVNPLPSFARPITPIRRGGATLQELRLSAWYERSRNSNTFSWLFVPVILDALGIPAIQHVPQAIRPGGWRRIIERYRRVFAAHGITEATLRETGALNEANYLPAEHQERLLGLDDGALLILNAFGTTAQFAIQQNLAPPLDIDLHPLGVAVI
jgi:hypothetical protein